MATPPAVTPLEISTLVIRPIVKIDGKKYELRNQDEFSHLGARQQRQTFQRMGALMQRLSKGLTKNDERELETLLEKFTEAILIAPPGIRKKLTIVHQWQLVEHFSALLRPTPTAGAPGQASRAHRKSGMR